MDKRRVKYNLTADVDIGRLLGAVLRRAWLVVITAVICAAVAFAGTKWLVTPQYEAAVMMYVNNANVSLRHMVTYFTGDSLRIARYLVDTYIVVLRSRTTLEEVIAQAGIDADVETIRDHIIIEINETMTAESVDETEIFKVVVRRDNPEEAERIANAIAVVLPRRIAEIMDKTSAKMVDAAVMPTSPVLPRPMNGLFLGGIFGGVLGVWFIVRRELFDNRVRVAADLEQFGEIVVLSEIPDLSDKG